ncbi:MAG: hypothetical protein HYX44_00175 [Aquabacterium sp.]|nr:hypothetical protein [Aquabacterium sp.]
MHHHRFHPTRLVRAIACALLLSSTVSHAPAAVTDLASSPLETSTATLVKPNILFVLDDSGSMSWDFLPDWANSSTDGLARNAGYNGIYYDPAITYTPPLKYDGSSYASMTAANSSNWTAVPFDGFGVQTPSNMPNTGTSNLFTTSSSGTTQNLVSSAYYYTFIPGEYCTNATLKTCVAQTSPSAAYPYPAMLRWCADSARTNCRATRIDTAPTGGSTYTYARYPGMTSPSVPGSNTRVNIVSTTNSYPYPGTTTKANTRTDCAGTTCSYAEEMTNFANWWAYYRMRMQMAKSAASLAFSVLDTSKRLGYMSINNNTGSDFLGVSDLTSGSTGQKAKWYNKLISARPNNSTPLRVALATAGRYYAGKVSTINGVSASDPMQYACQRNYTMLSTDGYWNESNTPTRIDGSTAIGDQDGTASRPYLDGTATANTLADVAQYYYVTDIRDNAFNNTNGVLGTDVANNGIADKQQRMYTSTVGLGASGYMRFQANYQTATSGDYYDVAQGTSTSTTTASNGVCSWQTSGSCNWPKAVSNTQTTIDDLWHAAVNGRGVYYSAANPAQLRDGLENFIQSVNSSTSDASAATTSNPNVSAGDNFVFKSTFHSGDWYGELARYTIDISTGALSAYPDWTQSGEVNISANTKGNPLLDNMPWATRKIYTYSPSSSTPLLPFDWASMPSSMQAFFKMANIDSLSQICSSGAVCLASAAQVDSATAGDIGAGGLNLVNFLRGDRSNEGPTTATYYRQRMHVLGDIVSSQAVYVKAPRFGYVDAGYAAYRSAQASRMPMLYVGANDGMLHAFKADTGVEAWAYIPSMLLPNLYKLADKKYSTNHVYYINATPAVGDVYVDGGWRTILVSGLGAGGRGFFALDITDPANPKVLWEFTSDTTKGTGYTIDADLGYSYGTPIITKLSDGTWAVIVTSGYNNVSPGSGRGIVWVLNAKTGAVIKKIDTGAGSSSGTVAGCSAAPCPAGLAKIAAYTDNNNANNMAMRLYGGDLLGNVWRIDVSQLTAAGGTATVQLLATLADANGTRQPITARPELGSVSGIPVVYVGTGAYLGVSDISTTGQQSIYAIKDPLTTVAGSSGIFGSPRAATCTASGKTNCFIKQILQDSGGIRTASSSVSYTVDYPTMNGWYTDLPETGERMHTDPDLQLGALVFTTNIPSASDACSVGGSSYLNYLDYRTGQTLTGSTQVGVLLSGGSTTALATAPTLVRLPNGKIISITDLSDGTTVTKELPPLGSSQKTRRVSWRELISNN